MNSDQRVVPLPFVVAILVAIVGVFSFGYLAAARAGGPAHEAKTATAATAGGH